jgi:hypothetical protein
MMAYGAEGNQILFGIIARLATEFFVVDLKIRDGPAGLTSPSIATQNLLP